METVEAGCRWCFISTRFLWNLTLVVLIKTWGCHHFQNSLSPAGLPPRALRGLSGWVGLRWGPDGAVDPGGATGGPLGPLCGGVHVAGHLLTILSLLFKGRSLSRSRLPGQCLLVPCCPGLAAVPGAGPSVSAHRVSAGALCVPTCGTVCLDPAGRPGPFNHFACAQCPCPAAPGWTARHCSPCPAHPGALRQGGVGECPHSGPVSHLSGADRRPCSVSACLASAGGLAVELIRDQATQGLPGAVPAGGEGWTAIYHWPVFKGNSRLVHDFQACVCVTVLSPLSL